MMTVAEWVWKGTKPSCLPIFKKTGSEWMNEWLNEWLNEWMNEWMNEWIGKCFILHQDNDPKHPASSVKEFIRAKKWKVFDCPSQSPDWFKSGWTWISPAEEEIKGRNSPKQATIRISCIKGWETYFKGWDQESGDVYVSQTHCCDCVQGICN